MAIAKREVDVMRERKIGAQRGLAPVDYIFGALSLIGLALSSWMTFFYAPEDALQKDAQRILYLHVACAWLGMLAFIVLAVASIICLVKKDERWDWIARANAEIGTVFITIALLTGAVWGRPIWGTWWVWDPKLTATLILWFMYVGYLMLRNYMGRTQDSQRAGAVMALVGAVDVPIIYLSVNWWRGQHPTQQIGNPDAGLPPSALATMFVAMIAFTFLFIFLARQVYFLQRAQTLAQRLRAMVS
ncbi:cytochrome c biogenesis protein CcsA [Ktedonospora formicarum]|uniref:Heme exporter protein C n=1 Tax=Ktedonospora formicarum TaxID=2778364 RepID=A0A8J3I1B1_9CHLR|nr:cytochrome c biogenesis protein CcsA [Ktedonospora formicarum]GHO43699.1 cytochrome C biogenesis protein CcmC [Ktedonospora formicarum]